jgi:hypothetical protein
MFAWLIFFGFLFLIWKTFTPPGGWKDEGGHWGRWRPKIRPPQGGPGGLPKSWDPPDYVPEWMVEEAERLEPIWIRPPRRTLQDQQAPLRARR